jgi:hypothetical protein
MNMMIGKYFTENLLQEWYLRELENARKVLRQFPLLNQLFDGFKGYGKKQYSETKNIVLLSCLPDFKGGLKPKSIESLAQIEDSINLFNIINWSMADYNQFKSRFCNDDYYTSVSVNTELIAAKHLAERIGEGNVKLYPKLKGGRFSDVLAKVNGRSIYIEIGNLTESLPEKKIQQILDNSSKHLGEKLGINCNCYLQINVDTAEFIVDKGRLDVDKSIKKLNSEIDKYGVHKLAGFKGLITLDDFVSICEESRKITLLPPNIEEFLNFINDSKIKDWMGSSHPDKLGTTKLIKSIGGAPLPTLLVEIHTEGLYPSKAAMAERDSFINHIIRNVEGQLMEEQIQPDEPNIIIVQGRNWTIWGEFELIGNRIQKFFEYRKEKYLSGIAVFEDFHNVMYVNNKYVEASSKLNQSEVNQLGYRWETC